MWKMKRCFLWLGVLSGTSHAAEWAWHHTPDCSDAPFRVVHEYPEFQGGKVPSACYTGAYYYEGDWSDKVDFMLTECNSTHLIHSVFWESQCMYLLANMTIAHPDVKRIYSGECVEVMSTDCCDEFGGPLGSPYVDFVQLHDYKGAVPNCPHCVKIPLSVVDDLAAHGMIPVSCEEDKRRRRLQGLPEGPPCPGESSKRPRSRPKTSRGTQPRGRKPARSASSKQAAAKPSVRTTWADRARARRRAQDDIYA